MIPIKYNFRSLRVRWVTTLLTVLGIGILVWASCLVFGLAEGLRLSLMCSGDPLDLVVLRQGSTNEINSGITLATAGELLHLDGIRTDPSGRRLAAAELVSVPVLERLDGSRSNVIIRGISDASGDLRPGFSIVVGRRLRPGTGECMVGRNLSGRFKGTSPGDVLRVTGGESYRVVGVFAAARSTAESEVWVDLKELGRGLRREGVVSSAQLRAATADDVERLRAAIAREPRFRLKALRETEYYASQEATVRFLEGAGTLISILLVIGASSAVANTMAVAIRSRTREIGTLRALGFSRFGILAAFLAESAFLCTLGGVIGLLATLPARALIFGVSSFHSYSESFVSLSFGPLTLAVVILMTVATGLLGGLLPALRAAGIDVIAALREA